MLKLAKLRLLTEPSTKIDSMELTALRCAHQRYPYFEFENMLKITSKLEILIKDSKYAWLNDKLKLFKQQLKNSKIKVDYYLTHFSREEALFENNYTSLVDKGVSEYMIDMLKEISKRELIQIEEVKNRVLVLEKV